MVRSNGLQTFSDVIGWIYFFAWSISFYPQVILNYKRKSVDGMSFEYIAYNLTGFLFYLIFSSVNFALQKANNLPMSVQPNDIAFAAHAVILTIVTASQVFLYERRGQKFSKIHAWIVAGIWIICLYSIGLSIGGVLPWYSLDQDQHYSYTFLESLGYSKLLISFVKYLPQAYLNFTRKSTVGWPIQNVLLDLTGGLGSFLQEFIDAYNKDNWGLFTSNIPKLFLAMESVVFDLVFIFQHFFLYKGQDPVTFAYDEHEDALIPKKNVEEQYLTEGEEDDGIKASA
jgi:cystinosin